MEKSELIYLVNHLNEIKNEQFNNIVEINDENYSEIQKSLEDFNSKNL